MVLACILFAKCTLVHRVKESKWSCVVNLLFLEYLFNNEISRKK